MRTVLATAVLGLLSSVVASAGVGVWTTNGPPGSEFGVFTDSTTPGVLYTGADSNLFRSTDNGGTWSTTLPLGGGGVTPLAAAAQRVFATGPYTGNNSAQVSLYASSDQGTHWTGVAVGDFGTSYVLAIEPSAPNTLYLGTTFYHRGLYGQAGFSRSTDGGLTWTYITTGLAAIGIIAVAPNAPGTLYVYTTSFPSVGGFIGIAKSVDSGASWSVGNASLQNVTALAADPSDASVVYVATGGSGVLKSIDSGQTFMPVNSGLTNLLVASICIDPLRSNRVYAATIDGVFASGDAGATWQAMNNGFTASNLTKVTSLAVDATGAFLHASVYGVGIFDYQITGLPCASSSTTLCLTNGRFAVTADFQTTPEGPSTLATAVPLTSDTGYFWFFDPSNIELVTKVLNGCAVDGDFWFFASGLTNVGVQINVTDTVTGATKPYSNTLGTAFQPIQDTSAFPCP